MHSRLKRFLPKNEYSTAKKILAHLSADPMTFNDLWPYIREQVNNDKETMHKLLKRLTDECYITIEMGLYRFVSPMLADWWKNSYGWET